MNKNKFFGDFYENSDHFRKLSSSKEFRRDINEICHALLKKFSSINVIATIIIALEKRRQSPKPRDTIKKNAS
tara:strand:- start:98 stop:316 length:219 start_codon:yes stop_codon:yes gene_type:complete